MNKVIVATREEALALIAGGTNSMLVFSPEAQYGYKKDGTPAGRRGRKALSDDVVAARAAKAAASGRTREKTGPIVCTADAPFGVKKDGTPMLKRGRPAKEVSVARRAAAVAEREARRVEREAAKVARKAAREAAKAAPLAVVADGTVAPVEAVEVPVVSEVVEAVEVSQEPLVAPFGPIVVVGDEVLPAVESEQLAVAS